MANTIEVEILLQLKAAQDGIKKLENQIDKMSENSGKGIKKLDIALGAFAGSIASLGFQKALAGAKDFFNFFITDGIKAAEEQEDAVNRMNIALQSTGDYTAETSQDLQDFASAMQNTTKYADELILENMALLKTLTSLSGDGLKEATKASLDMATALQIDLRTATMLVAKASEGNTEALKKYGIEVKKGATDAETFANALTELNRKFGGSATGSINTFAGAMAQLHNTVNELQESFGNLVIKNPAVISAIQQANKIIQDLAGYVTLAGGEFEDFISFIAEQGVVVLQGLAEAFKLTVQATLDIKSALEGAKTAWEDFSGVSTADNFSDASHALDEVNQKLEEQEKILVKLSAPREFPDNLVPDSAVQKMVDDTIAKIKTLQTEQIAAQANLNGIMAKGREADLKATQDNATKKSEIKKSSTSEEIAEEEKKLKTIADAQKQYSDALALEKVTRAEAERVAMEGGTEFEKQFLENKLGELAVIKLDAQIKELEAKGLHEEALQKMEDKAHMESINATRKKVKTEAEIEKQKEQDRKDTIDTIASMQNSSNKTMATVGKAFAIYQTTLSTYEGIGKALGAFPPPYNFAMAALVGAAGFANVAKTAGMNFADGGIVGGNSYHGDRVPAMVNSGEMILNRRQQENLFDNIDNSANGGGGGTVINIQGNVIADDDSQLDRLMDRINDSIEFRNMRLRGA